MHKILKFPYIFSKGKRRTSTSKNQEQTIDLTIADVLGVGIRALTKQGNDKNTMDELRSALSLSLQALAAVQPVIDDILMCGDDFNDDFDDDYDEDYDNHRNEKTKEQMLN